MNSPALFMLNSRLFTWPRQSRSTPFIFTAQAELLEHVPLNPHFCTRAEPQPEPAEQPDEPVRMACSGEVEQRAESEGWVRVCGWGLQRSGGSLGAIGAVGAVG